MLRLAIITLLLGLTALGQTPAGRSSRVRPATPTRDPHTPGYVEAKELPDGEIPSAKADGNFILGPTHPAAPEMAVLEGVPHGQIFSFTMESTESKIYPGIARESGTFAQPDPSDRTRVTVKSHPAPDRKSTRLNSSHVSES